MQKQYRVKVGSYWLFEPADIHLGEVPVAETPILTNLVQRACLLDKEGAIAWAALLNGTACRVK